MEKLRFIDTISYMVKLKKHTVHNVLYNEHVIIYFTESK